MHHNQNGFTLPEILIGLAISSIIIAASFASYIVIKNNYDFQKDMKNISQTSRAVATMIMRDIRMAGYNYDDGPTKQKPEITNAIKITDGGTTAPDAIEIIYDKSYTERLKISYYTKTYNNRLRVYKKIEKCNAMNCASSSLQTVIAESPIADYVEDLQFVGTRNSVTLGTGQITYGQGNRRMITPSSVKSTSCTGGEALMIDGSYDTYYECSTANSASFDIKFDKKFRIEQIYISTVAHLDGGSLINSQHPFDTSYPYGTKNSIDVQANITNKGSLSDCAWSSACGSTSNPRADGLIFVGRDAFCGVGGSSSNDCYLSSSTQDDFYKYATDSIEMRVDNRWVCTYTGSGQACNPTSAPPPPGGFALRIGNLSFYGEVFGEMQSPQEVEVGLLIRSPEEHGTTPKSQTFQLGNRPVVTNDNYIRDSYSISALVRNQYYGS